MKCREALIARSDDFHIILDDIAITHLTFGHEYAQAVEMKQVAQQEAERARFVVERAEQEKVANVIRAEGDSKAAELISQSLHKYGTGLIELRKIEVRSMRLSERGGREKQEAHAVGPFETKSTCWMARACTVAFLTTALCRVCKGKKDVLRARERETLGGESQACCVTIPLSRCGLRCTHP